MKRIKLIILLVFCFVIQNINAQVDTFATLIGNPKADTTGWILSGQATVKNDSGILLCNNVKFQKGAIFYNKAINLSKCSRWVADFDFRIHDGDGADGITFSYLDSFPPKNGNFNTGQGVGIPDSYTGLKILFDTYSNCGCDGNNAVQSMAPKIEVRWDAGYTAVTNCNDSTTSVSNSGGIASLFGNGECNALSKYPTRRNNGGDLNFIRSDTFNHAQIKFNNGRFNIYLNGKLYMTDSISPSFIPSVGYLGFTASTGNHTDNHYVKNVIIRSDIPPSDAGLAKSICSGKSAILGTSTNSIFTYKWTPSTDLNSDTLSAPIVSIVNNTTAPITHKYYVNTSYDVSSTCTTKDSVIVTVNPYPHLNAILGNKNICINKTSQFTNDTIAGVWLWRLCNRKY